MIQEALLNSVSDAIRAANFLAAPHSLGFMQALSQMMAETFAAGGKILVAGNGGSCCDAMHFAEELTGQFRKRRPALAAISLSDVGHITCCANDFGFDQVFARSIEALGKPGDLFVALTTSGNSPNIIRAVQMAKARDLKTVAFLGKTGGDLRGQCDLEWIVEGFSTSDRIQEAHMAAIHIVIEMCERILYPSLYGQLSHAG